MSTPSIEDLAKGVSTQVIAANRRWIILITVTIYVLVAQNSSGEVTLPFNFGKVDHSWFYLISTVFISVVSISFAMAQCQNFRAARMAQAVLDKMEKDDVYKESYLSPRAQYDCFVVGSFNRVAPLAQVHSGNENLGGLNISGIRGIIISTYYYILKLSMFIVFYLLPGIAVSLAFILYLNSSSPIKNNFVATFVHYSVWIIFFIAVITFLQTIILEIIYTVNSGKAMRLLKTSKLEKA